LKLTYPGGLHNHTEYSNLRLRDSINKADEMIDYAISLGHEVIAITEHETISNAIKVENYYNKIKKDHPNFKVIFGNEIYLCRDGLNAQNFDKNQGDKYFHFILLAKDAIGHRQIRELSTRAWNRSYMTGKMRRVPTYYQDLLDIIAVNPGHVIGSTACLGGFLGTKLVQLRNMGESDFKQVDEFVSKIENWLELMENIFGKGNFFLEMQPSPDKDQIYVNKEILLLSKSLNIPYIITTDSHYLNKADAPIHEAFLNSQEGDREVASFYQTTYLMDTEELESFMSDYMTEENFQEAYQNILNIKNMCEDFSFKKPLKIPSLEWRKPSPSAYANAGAFIKEIPMLSNFLFSDFEGDRTMARLIVDKLLSNPELMTRESYDEINENLKITWISSEVNKAHWSAYFLNLQKTLDVCWDAGTIVGPGRGSGVGFYLLYILDIIQINPMWETTKTFAWRFLNPDRVSVLDIDTDIEGGRRAQVLQKLREYYGQDRVANVVTFGTEGSKSAIQTAARGLGIDNDVSLYISSLIPADRGKVRTLHQAYYGDVENDFKPIPLFVQQMNEYPELWKVAQKIEGIVCRVGEHAGGVIFVDEAFTNSTALMKVPNGDIVTQFDLHDCEAASLIKIDLLSVEALDKIHTCLDLLCEYNYIEQQPTLKETYMKYLGIYNLERESKEMWEMVHNHEIQSLFQMEKQSGIQGIALTKPTSVDDLAVLNSVIRLMPQSKDDEQPLVKYARFKHDINFWYDEMKQYGLKDEDRELLEPIVGLAYGICESQEKFMQLVQLPECGGFDLTWADRLRKSIAKKNPAEYEQLTKEYFERVEEKGLNRNLCNYVWNVLVATSRGYGFNASHTLAYSLVALQEMNLAYKYPIIFWNCACLITDSGGAEQLEEDDGGIYMEAEEEVVDIYEPEDFDEYEYIDAPDRKTKVKKKRAKSTDYKKIATAIGKMMQEGIQIMPPNINNSSYTFTPDVENNQIIFGLSGILNVGEDVIKDTIAGRPYISPRDYLNRVKPKRQAMVSLIKGGAFDEMMDRRLCMAWYIWETCDKKKRLTLQNMGGLLKYNIIPDENENIVMGKRIYEFTRYLKSICKNDKITYRLDERAINFLSEINCDDLIFQKNEEFHIKCKEWDNVYQKWMNIFRNWIVEHKDEALENLNNAIFMEDWNKYAIGTISAWEMKSLCFYYHEHELENANYGKYGIVDFFSLPEEPVVDRSFVKGGKTINLFKLTKICGTCIAKDKNKSTVTLLTPEGVVTVKFRKGHFALFDKQISSKNSEGVKKILEKSWFNRGCMIMVQGFRSGDQFIAKSYANSIGHTLYKIISIDSQGDLTLTSERIQGDETNGTND
jgi:DNA polymerase-3 subunit alpha